LISGGRRAFGLGRHVVVVVVGAFTGVVANIGSVSRLDVAGDDGSNPDVVSNPGRLCLLTFSFRYGRRALGLGWFGDLVAIVAIVIAGGGADLVPCRFVAVGVGSDPGTSATSGGSYWFDPGDRPAVRASWDRRSAVAAVVVVVSIIGGGADAIPCRFVAGGVGSHPDTSATSGGPCWFDPDDRLAIRASWDRWSAVVAVVVVVAIIGGGADATPCRFVAGGVGSHPDTLATSGGSFWVDPGDRLAVRASWDRRRAVVVAIVVGGRWFLLRHRLWMAGDVGACSGVAGNLDLVYLFDFSGRRALGLGWPVVFSVSGVVVGVLRGVGDRGCYPRWIVDGGAGSGLGSTATSSGTFWVIPDDRLTIRSGWVRPLLIGAAAIILYWWSIMPKHRLRPADGVWACPDAIGEPRWCLLACSGSRRALGLGRPNLIPVAVAIGGDGGEVLRPWLGLAGVYGSDPGGVGEPHRLFLFRSCRRHAFGLGWLVAAVVVVVGFDFGATAGGWSRHCSAAAILRCAALVTAPLHPIK
jgi:hypothetical protein